MVSTGEAIPAAGQTSEKLPARSSAEGTCWLNVPPGTISRRTSSEKKKKVLSFLVL